MFEKLNRFADGLALSTLPRSRAQACGLGRVTEGGLRQRQAGGEGWAGLPGAMQLVRAYRDWVAAF
jgi:hypothetical protein